MYLKLIKIFSGFNHKILAFSYHIDVYVEGVMIR